jgi:hypothetical protein
MKFSEHSWHVKANYISFRWVPNGRISLCPYFWMTVGAVIGMPFILALRPVYHWFDAREPWSQDKKERVAWEIIIGLWVVIFAYWSWTAVVYALQHGLWATLGLIGFYLGLVGLIILIVIGSGYLVLYYQDHHVPKARPASKPRQPSLLKEWAKAKKSKVCPIIEWEE